MEYLGILFCFLGVNMITRIKGLGKKVTVISNLEGNPLCDVCGLETKRVKVCFHGSSPRAPKCSIAIGELYSILDSKLFGLGAFMVRGVSASNFWGKESVGCLNAGESPKERVSQLLLRNRRRQSVVAKNPGRSE